MGLAQKRISQEFQTNVFPAWKKQFDATLGFEVPIEVKWDTMLSDDYSDKDQYTEWYNQVYFTPLMNAFKDVCSDNMGKEAIKGALKKVVIDGTEGHYPEHSTFENGVFTLNHKFSTNTDQVSQRADGWKKMIESKL